MATATANKGKNIVDSHDGSLLTSINPRLVAIHGPLSGQTIYLDEPVVSIGRQSSSDICLEDVYASRNHCLITNEGEQYILEDLNSVNGTYVNGERVQASALKEGSLIHIGTSRFLFRLRNPEESIPLSQNLGQEHRQDMSFAVGLNFAPQ